MVHLQSLSSINLLTVSLLEPILSNYGILIFINMLVFNRIVLLESYCDINGLYKYSTEFLRPLECILRQAFTLSKCTKVEKRYANYDKSPKYHAFITTTSLHFCYILLA